MGNMEGGPRLYAAMESRSVRPSAWTAIDLNAQHVILHFPCRGLLAGLVSTKIKGWFAAPGCARSGAVTNSFVPTAAFGGSRDPGRLTLSLPDQRGRPHPISMPPMTSVLQFGINIIFVLFSSLHQLNIVHLRERLSRAQGESGPTPTNPTASRTAPAVPQHVPTHLKPTPDNQYYPQVQTFALVSSILYEFFFFFLLV